MNPLRLPLVIGLTAIVAALIGVLVFAVLRFAAAARDSQDGPAREPTETAFVTAALQEALTKLKAQEREMSARAEASERLSSEIVESLTSGLLVVGSDGRASHPESGRPPSARTCRCGLGRPLSRSAPRTRRWRT